MTESKSTLYRKTVLFGGNPRLYPWSERSPHASDARAPEDSLLSVCPSCGGDADNGQSRDYPPVPYYCKRCDALLRSAGPEVND